MAVPDDLDAYSQALSDAIHAAMDDIEAAGFPRGDIGFAMASIGLGVVISRRGAAGAEAIVKGLRAVEMERAEGGHG